MALLSQPFNWCDHFQNLLHCSDHEIVLIIFIMFFNSSEHETVLFIFIMFKFLRTFVHIGSTLAHRLTHLLLEIQNSKGRTTNSQANQLSAWGQAVKDLSVVNDFLIEIRQISPPGKNQTFIFELKAYYVWRLQNLWNWICLNLSKQSSVTKPQNFIIPTSFSISTYFENLFFFSLRNV